MKRSTLIFTTVIALPFAAFISSCSNDTETPAESASGQADDSYPLTTCVVSGEELGSMGDPVVHDHNGTTVKFCCENCIPKFQEDPDTYLSKLNNN